MALALVVAVGVAGVGVAVPRLSDRPADATGSTEQAVGTQHRVVDDDAPLVQRPGRPANAPVVPVPAPSPPRFVDIPAIAVRSALEPLPLDADGTLRSPGDYQVAGWFADGTEPGQPGPAVIAGHVDSADGPAVFYQLDLLVVGDEVLVERVDGSVVRFEVSAVERHPKDEFPAQAVYGPVPGPELRLITCDGPFDRDRGQYRDNLVVFAVMADQPELLPG